ncbi:MAG: hypothetical protein IT281_03885 [Ignavibacteria bacterium]|nr:hypothetical protein [Ignavibacteria bacterium]
MDPLSVTNISGNTVRNLTRTQSVIGSGTCYGMYISSGGRIMNVFNNTVNDLYNSTTGTLGGLYTFPSANIYNVYGNTVRDLRKLEGGSGAMYCLYYSQSTPITVVYNNQVYNITCGSSTSTSVIYGMYNNGSPPAVGGIENVNNNTVHDITHMGTTASTSLFFVGIYSGTGTTGGCDKVLYGNSVYNVTTNYGQTGGIYMNYADTAYIYKNRIYNIRNTTGIGNTPQTYGILMTNTIATAVYFTYNNFISELYADMNPTFPAILGIWHNGTLASGHYYNTIYLNATSSGTNFGTMALYIAGTTPNVDLRNNIVVNKSVATGTGATVCLFRADTTTTNYNSASNNNNFYAGTPSAQNLIYLDPSISTPHAFQTISDFKTYVAPRENNSFTEDSPFLNTTTHPYNLHMSTVIPTACEGGGIPISAPFAITTDYDGNTRNAVTPDVGADEFAGLPAVITVNLNVVPGGFYNSATGKLRMRDTVRAYLVDSAAGCLKVDSAKGVLDSVTFLTSFTFNNASNGNYFLVVKHRNHVVISSSNRITVTRGAVTAYNFTDAGTKAYGSNMIQVSSSPVVWGMLPGDINQDQFVDGLDQTIWVGQSGLDGYLRGDLNGDGFVDGLDQSLWVPYSGLGSIMPCGFTRPLNTKQFDGSIKIKDNQQPNEGKKINR